MFLLFWLAFRYRTAEFAGELRGGPTVPILSQHWTIVKTRHYLEREPKESSTGKPAAVGFPDGKLASASVPGNIPCFSFGFARNVRGQRRNSPCTFVFFRYFRARSPRSMIWRPEQKVSRRVTTFFPFYALETERSVGIVVHRDLVVFIINFHSKASVVNC